VVAPVAVVLLHMPSSVLGDGSDSEYVIAPFHTPHYKWDCFIGSPSASSEELVSALIDNGSHAVLISPEVADRLGLTHQKLPIPEEVELVMAGGVKDTFMFEDWVPLGIVSSDQAWSSRTVRAIVSPGLCVPLLLSGPFLSNRLVMDHELHTCIDKSTNFDILNPPEIKGTIIKPAPIFGPEEHKALQANKKTVVDNIKNLFPQMRTSLEQHTMSVSVHPVTAVCTHIENFLTKEKLRLLDAEFKNSYTDLFPTDILHVSELPTDVLMTIKL